MALGGDPSLLCSLNGDILSSLLPSPRSPLRLGPQLLDACSRLSNGRGRTGGGALARWWCLKSSRVGSTEDIAAPGLLGLQTSGGGGRGWGLDLDIGIADPGRGAPMQTQPWPATWAIQP